MDALFSSSKLKIERANKHIDELNAVLDTYLKTHVYTLSIEKDPNDGSNKLKFESSSPIPREVPLIIGDAIHNLHSSLDLMACEIVTLAGATPSKWVRFPFRDNRAELIAALNGGEIKVAGSAIIDLIVDEIKPYKGGNDPLCGLHDLDIMDKHRLLILVISIIGLRGACAEDERGGRFQNLNLFITQPGKLNIIKDTANMKITNYGQPSFDILFDKGQIFEGRSVIPMLHQLSQLVSGVVQTIETAFNT